MGTGIRDLLHLFDSVISRVIGTGNMGPGISSARGIVRRVRFCLSPVVSFCGGLASRSGVRLGGDCNVTKQAGI